MRLQITLPMTVLAAPYAFCVWIVSRCAPEPYMDEIFHVPQTIKYYHGQWRSWDPKITTFPGLYVIGTAFARVYFWTMSLVGREEPQQTAPQHFTFPLRATNATVALLSIFVFMRLYETLSDDSSRGEASTPRHRILLACCFALTPLHFFFSFLWYTDVASTLSFLALWWIVEDAARRRNVVETQRSGSLRPFYHFVGSGLLAVGSIAMRQTNAVWVAFVAARVLLLTCLPPRAPASAAVVTSNVPRTTRQRKGQKRYVVQEIVENACLHRRRLIMLTCPLMPPLLAFAAFVKYNGGVAIGDKQNHQPVLHWAQPFYCALYCSLALFPVLWTPSEVKKTAIDVAKATRRRPWAAVVCIAVLIGAIRYGTLVHPFLLADNRHYTFYIWRRILDRTPWMRFAFVPAYVHSCAAIYRLLYAAGRHPLEIGLLAASAVAVLLPTRLIELRYFTPPLCAVFVLAKTPNLRQLMVLMVAYAILDAATLYAFVFLPFTWPDGSVARFMW